MDKTITLRPHLSEKTYGLSTARVYVVEVPKNANRHTVARAVEAQFDVKVEKVNIANISGKPKRVISVSSRRMKNANGQTTGLKKAYITLAKGNSLPFFAALEEEEAKEEALQEKFDKAAAKQAEKTDKTDKPARRGLRRTKQEETK